MTEKSFNSQDDERAILASWLVQNFTYTERKRTLTKFYERFDLSFGEALKGIEGKFVLIFVIQAILYEPKLDDLKDFGYSPEQISQWAMLRSEIIKSIMSFPEEKIPELKTFLSDGMNIYDSVNCALRV
jgi:hypothetical protein